MKLAVNDKHYRANLVRELPDTLATPDAFLFHVYSDNGMLFQFFYIKCWRESVLKYVIYFNFSNFIQITFLFISHEGNVLKNFINVLIYYFAFIHLRNFPVICLYIWSYIFTVTRTKKYLNFFVKFLFKSNVHWVSFFFLL